MMGNSSEGNAKLFYIGFNLADRVPMGHALRRINKAVDFSFVRPLVAALYGYNGNVSIDPTLALKLMFLCFFENIRSERELMQQLPLRLDWLWFCGLDLDSVIPDHSVLSKARRRWGERTFERLFSRVLQLCQEGGLLEGRTVHADSTLLKANASLEGRVSRKLWEQLEQSAGEDLPCPEEGSASPAPSPLPAQEAALPSKDQVDEANDEDVDGSGGGIAQNQDHPASKSAKPIKLNDRLVSPVDPDAGTSTRKAGGTTLGYRDHRLVDDKRGVIVVTVATAANVDDGAMLGELLARQLDYAGQTPVEVVGDSMYGSLRNYAELKKRKIKAYLKKRRGKDSPKISWLKQLPEECRPSRARQLLGRRKAMAEGSFAEAHTRMNHRRCRWRRRWRVQIQCYMLAMVQNVKKLTGLGCQWNSFDAGVVQCMAA
jgi:transposase